VGLEARVSPDKEGEGSMSIGKDFRVAVLHLVEEVGLGLILVATVVAVGQEVAEMVRALKVSLADLLLLFIYLEVVAMVAIYFESHQLPVRFPLYIAMVALARYIILDSKAMGAWQIIAVGTTILLLAATVLLLRFGQAKFPSIDAE
jgi:protein PsiE